MPGRASQRAIPAEQRVFSLVLALVASANGLTKRELLSSVYGYADRFRPGETDPSLERQFERDKEQLRRLGIPIDTLDSPEEPGNTQLTRYRIAKDRLQAPAQVRFTASELSLLRLASMAWAEGSLSLEARRAAMKLESLGAGLDVRHLGLAPRIGIPEPAAPALQQAIDARRIARFGYQTPDHDAPLERRVAPLRLHRADGRWHLLAWDLEREAGRVFLLARVVGEVRLEASTFAPELADRVEGMLEELLALRNRQRAQLQVRIGSTAEARLSARALQSAGASMPEAAEFRALTVPTLDFSALASELAEYGGEVIVTGPAALQQAVVALLERVRAQHGGEAGPAASRPETGGAEHV